MSNDPYYISASIPYVNGEPHLGHAMEFVIADILSRYHAQFGRDVFFSMGADEHGGKIMETAKSAGKSTEAFVEENVSHFKQLAIDLNVEYTKFIRTGDEEHKARAAYIWQALGENIYKGSYSGMYDQKEEQFLTHEEAREIQKDEPTRYGRLTELKEENYFFKLAKYNNKLIELIKTDQMKIIPKSRKNEMLAFLESGLDDMSISRPSEKIPWGIGVPNDSTQTIYVWFEALMNYITTLGYPDGSDFAKFWPADVHVIGKDITRFHTVIWPAMLLALGVEPPRAVFVHGFINDVNGEIMSKSKGNGVAPKEIIQAYGSDSFRYFVAKLPSGEDGNFSWERFETMYNTELGNELGNLVQRTASMITRYEGGVIGNLPESMHDIAPYHDYFEAYRFDLALDYVWTLIRGLNQYIEDQKPWELAKEDDKAHLQEVLAYIVASLLQVADMLNPFLPSTSAQIIQMFGDGTVHMGEQSLFPRVNTYTQPGKQHQKG